MANTYAPELKAQVIAAFQMGASKSALARQFKVPRTTVIDWLEHVEPTVPTVTDAQKREELGGLVYDYLSAGLQALIAQAGAMGDTEWFKKQGPSTYLIHGTLADKLVVIFGGVERGQQPADDA